MSQKPDTWVQYSTINFIMHKLLQICKARKNLS
jgi:hypothetical protein